MKITVLQPSYFAGNTPDATIAEILMDGMREVERDALVLLPEYSNAGGISDAAAEIAALPRAKKMLADASATARDNHAYVAINVLEERDGGIWNSTYLFDREGRTAFVYDKAHLPPSEVELGVAYGDGTCICELDGIRFGFLTCYDVYFNEQIEYLARHKPDIILIPGYQRGEDVEILRAQTRLIAFRCNSYVAKSSYSMESDSHGGCSMIVAPDGKVLADMGKQTGSASADVDLTFKHTRSAGYGRGKVRNDDFINMGMRPEIFKGI